MNAFTDMRRRYFESHSNESFAEYYLTHRCYVSDADDIARNQLIGKIAAIRALYEKGAAEENDILYLLAELGDHPYLDRYMVELLIQNKNLLLRGRAKITFSAMLCGMEISPEKMAHLIDVCIECDLPLLTPDRLPVALLFYRNDLDVVSTLIEYCLHFSVADSLDLLRELLSEPYPENIKLQSIDYLLAVESDADKVVRWLQDHPSSDPSQSLYRDYLRFRQEKLVTQECGLVVIQTMFYGDPEYSGKGHGGGLGTLLKTLGNQLTKHEQISLVITLTIHQNWNEHKPFLLRYDSGHLLVRLPIYLSTDDRYAFVKRELAIKRAVARFLSLWQIQPDILHVRYLDNASKAMAKLAKQMNAKLVFTLTPDPHRNMTDANGDIVCFKVDETLEKLNKITIGDELLAMTDGIVGIGGDSIRQELALYFPQLKQIGDPFDVRMISEGIDTSIGERQLYLWQFLETHALGYSIAPLYTDLPIILSIGRLNDQKGQALLLKAWGESQLWHDYNLIIIGGSRHDAHADEAAIMVDFQTFMDSHQELSGRFAHIEALPNADIRSIERTLMENTSARLPNVYVCPSVKEEFGISILEAMSEGFLIFAPIKGGVKTYLTSGQNGFLIDTTDASSIQQGLETVLYDSHLQHADFERIMQSGRRTVLNHFSMDEIAKNFAELYLGLSADDGLMCLME